MSDAGSEQSASPSAGTADWFRSLADYAAVLVWTADARGNVTYLNSYWLSFTGRPEATQLGSGWIEAVHPDDRPAMLRDFANPLAQRRR
ncbi:MAG: PAS domain S-box protein [Pseudomonadota bacterium]